jgi:hypothetical protein
MQYPLIFTHYGNSDYLSRTLGQATASNPNVRRILLGDTANYQCAIDLGWEHVLLEELVSSERDLFNARFRWVQGPSHQAVKGGKDWLRYVSERFYCLRTFIQNEGIKFFWHFDSDVMILHDLGNYAQRLIDLDIASTTLCNDSCPSGLISSNFLDDYCNYMIRAYEDREWLRTKDEEFASRRQNEAFTEMEAFCNFRHDQAVKTIGLSNAFLKDGVWFDAAICLDEGGFQMKPINRIGYSRVKNLASHSGKIYGNWKGLKVEMAIINCSWVGEHVYDWIVSSTKSVGSHVMPLDAYLKKHAKKRLPAMIKRKWRNMLNDLRFGN